AVDKDSINVEAGKTATINVTNTTGATFVSDKEDIATVDAAGVVTGVSMGSANIIVKKDGFYSAKVAVTVTEVQEAGEIRLEAELAEEVVAGTSSFMNLTDSTSGITRPHSGGGYISGYNVSGEEVLTFKFNAEAAQAGKYELSVNGSPAYGVASDFMFKDSCSITLNTNAVSINADAKIAAGDGSMSAPRVDATLGEVTIVAGENTLVVTFHGSAPSLDFFRLVPKA
ncbi:MAG: Ig-like domain-containing protein, partial [Bacilli bacterium]|nr:Ig-like domain-containing protein [Bacilli bacterium]